MALWNFSWFCVWIETDIFFHFPETRRRLFHIMDYLRGFWIWTLIWWHWELEIDSSRKLKSTYTMNGKVYSKVLNCWEFEIVYLMHEYRVIQVSFGYLAKIMWNIYRFYDWFGVYTFVCTLYCPNCMFLLFITTQIFQFAYICVSIFMIQVTVKRKASLNYLFLCLILYIKTIFF